MSWEKIKLSECCSSISDGDHQPPPKAEFGVPFVTISNINSNKFDFSDTMYVPYEYYDELDNKRKAQIGDVLYSVVGSFGIPVYIKENIPFVFQRHIAICRPDNRIIFPKFLYYTMLTRDFYAKADAAAIGAVQRTVSLNALRNIEIMFPTIDTQRRIASILSAYDDLIENNQEQIKLLEEAAQRLYKEWFVDLRFPGYENTKIVDGVPEGWKMRFVSNFGKVITGKTPSTTKQEYYGDDIPFVTIPDMHNNIFPILTEKRLSKQGADSQKSKYLPINSVMVSCIATVGLVNLAFEPCQTNQQINSVILNDEKDIYFFYLSMKRIKSLLDGVGSNGATMTNVNKSKFESIKVIYPDNEVLSSFHKATAPIFEKIKNNSVAIIKLRQARDRLLSKLMSGELEV